MNNLCIFCGKMVEKPVLKELEDGRKVVDVKLSIPRKSNGKETDEFINFSLWNKSAETLVETVKKDDAIAVKGKILGRTVDVMGTNINMLYVKPEKVTCLDNEKVNDEVFQSTIFLIGRLVKNPELITTESGKKVSNFTIAMNRLEKNAEGVYETDFIQISAWGNVGETISDYCKKGDLIGVTGSFVSKTNDYKGVEYDTLNIRANKVTFLSTKKYDEEETKTEEKTTKTKKTKKEKESEIEVA